LIDRLIVDGDRVGSGTCRSLSSLFDRRCSLWWDLSRAVRELSWLIDPRILIIETSASHPLLFEPALFLDPFLELFFSDRFP